MMTYRKTVGMKRIEDRHLGERPNKSIMKWARCSEQGESNDLAWEAAGEVPETMRRK